LNSGTLLCIEKGEVYMFKSVSPEQRQAWKEKIEQQRHSGLPIARWCKENNITIGRFYYWREKFFPNAIKHSEFLELTPPTKTGIKMECKGVVIDLEPHFDAPTLKRCLALLKEFAC
jgi:hypothetical protein